jgi:ABC-type glutathione transport system ATPase component
MQPYAAAAGRDRVIRQSASQSKRQTAMSANKTAQPGMTATCKAEPSVIAFDEAVSALDVLVRDP